MQSQSRVSGVGKPPPARRDRDPRDSALAAAAGDATPIGLRCPADPIALRTVTYYRMVVTDPAVIDTLVQTGGHVGIAYALQSGLFHAMRFPVDGARKALLEMEQFAAMPAQAPTSPTPPDTARSGDF